MFRSISTSAQYNVHHPAPLCIFVSTKVYLLPSLLRFLFSQIVSILQSTADKQSISIPDELAASIANGSGRNVRRALLMMEACHVRDDFQGNPATAVIETDWELYIKQLAQDITREQTPMRLRAAREKLYELLVNCIPPSIIMKTLVKELLPTLDDSLKPQVLEWAAFYEHRMTQGSKEIFHLEAFLAKYMAIYKAYLTDMFG